MSLETGDRRNFEGHASAPKGEGITPLMELAKLTKEGAAMRLGLLQGRVSAGMRRTHELRRTREFGRRTEDCPWPAARAQSRANSPRRPHSVYSEAKLPHAGDAHSKKRSRMSGDSGFPLSRNQREDGKRPVLGILFPDPSNPETQKHGRLAACSGIAPAPASGSQKGALGKPFVGSLGTPKQLPPIRGAPLHAGPPRVFKS